MKINASHTPFRGVLQNIGLISCLSALILRGLHDGAFVFQQAEPFPLDVPVNKGIGRGTKQSTYQYHQHCLEVNDVENKIKNAGQIVIAMPAKAAGSTMKAFTRECMGRTFPDNFLNNEAGVINTLLLGEPLEVPKIISSHLYTDKPLIKLIQQLPNSALLIYIHREEVDRLKSAIMCVYSRTDPELCNIDRAQGCTIGERSLVKTIKARTREIGIGEARLLTCSTYTAIKDNAPNMIFAHYKQAGVLQRLLAKYYCPNMIEKEIKDNVRTKHQAGAMVTVNGTEVPLEKWVNEKKDIMQFALSLREDSSCLGATREMEDRMFNCHTELILLV